MDPAKKTTLLKRLLFGGLTIGLIVAIAYLDAFVIGPWPSVAVLSGLSVLAHFEIRKMIEGKLGASLARIPGWLGFAYLLLTIATALFLEKKNFHALPLLFAAIVIVQVSYFIKRYPVHDEELRGAVLPYLSFYLPVAVYSLLWIRRDPAMGELPGLLYLIAIAKVGDIAAYFVGSFAGKRKFAPLISPNKTWEGAVASVLAAVALASFLPSREWSAGMPLLQSMAVGFVVNIAAQWSDLGKSVLKRACGVKDSGSYFSVMGGALDMIDSLIFAAPAYVALRLLWA